MAEIDNFPGLPDQQGWTGLDQLVDTMRLTKAAILTGDREHAALMAKRLVQAYGPDEAAQVYNQCVSDVKGVHADVRSWWFPSLVE